MGTDRSLLPRRAGAGEAAGLVHVPRFRRHAALAEGRAILLPALRRRSREGAGLDHLRLLAPRLQLLRAARHLRHPALAASLALESAEIGRDRAGPRLQHG